MFLKVTILRKSDNDDVLPLLVFQRRDGEHDDEDDDALHALGAEGDSDDDSDDMYFWWFLGGRRRGGGDVERGTEGSTEAEEGGHGEVILVEMRMMVLEMVVNVDGQIRKRMQ